MQFLRTTRAKTFIAFILISTIPIITANYMHYTNLFNSSYDSLKSDNLNFVDKIDTAITLTSEQIYQFALAISQDSYIHSRIGEHYENENTYVYSSEMTAYLMRNSVYYSSLVKDILIIDNKQNVFGNGFQYNYDNIINYISNAADDNIEHFMTIEDINFFRQSYSDSKFLPYIFPIKNANTQVQYGYLILNINTQVYSGFIDSGSIETGVAIYDSNFNVIESNLDEDLAQQVNAKFLDNIDSGNYEGKDDYFVSYLRNETTGYYIVCFSDIDESTWNIVSVRNQTLSLSLIILGVCLILAFYFSEKITQKTKTLMDAMLKFEKGNHDIQLLIEDKDEFTLLYEKFNTMVKNLNKLNRTIQQKNIEVSKAQFLALQAQINPHFLFNTLDSINWMLVEESNLKASQAVVTLGRILRYNIEQDIELTTIKREVTYLQDYLYIQKLRFNSRLNYDIFYSQTLEDCNIQRMLIQPLVENSINHNLATSSSFLKINISIEDCVDTIKISVTDNGMGFNDEALERVKASFNNNSPSSKGIGMSNVNNRLLLFYGESSNLKIETGKKETCISFIIKKRKLL